ncbi:NAD(P)H-binding protein [uncultured Sphingomonas sp.]|uniref:NAD(P)H-binding protein n=1 Tax=uncultured Sphingomonas sp. TaxID=158754 RepID=UPI003748AE0A
MYAVTGASGQLGRLVIEALLEQVAPEQIIALVRDPATVAGLAARGVVARRFDYDQPATLAPALSGVDGLLLISSNALGVRTTQHRAVVQAVTTAGVGHLVYTSILHADANPMNLATEHRDTEAAIAASGVPHTILRNGWYTEYYAAAAPTAVRHGVLAGSAGQGRIAAASRADYALAAATALLAGVSGAGIHELAGDDAFTLDAFAGEIGAIAAVPVVYRDLPEAAYRALLEQAGLPAPVAAMLAESDAKAADDSLYDDGHALSRLIGRPTTPWRETLRATLSQ